ncbi:MAG TPA: TonB family protein [Terracidiphilus sp.]
MENPTTRTRPAVVVSVGLHAALLSLLLVGGARMHQVRAVPPAKAAYLAMLQVAGGARRVSIPSFEAPNTSKAEKPQHVKEAEQKITNPTRPAHKEKETPSALPQDSTGKGTGTAVAGNGADAQDATPAFPVFSPKPPVRDRGLLPAAEQHIVVDVNVSETGDVTGLTLVKGMGNGLDQIVLDTVKTWRFHPATVNGSPVASEAELIFPFNLSYPVGRG